MNEKVLEKKLREKVKSKGGLCLKINSQTFTGLPDRLVLMPEGEVFFAELKSTGKKPSTRQRFVHNILLNMGFTVAVIDSNESLNTFLEKL